MTSPTTTAALPLANLIDDLVGNASGETVRISLNRLAAVIAAVMGPTYATRAQLYADKAWPAGSVGYVRADETTGRNGVYKKSGAVGSGSWTRVGDLPSGAIEAALIDQIRDEVRNRRVATIWTAGFTGVAFPEGTDTVIQRQNTAWSLWIVLGAAPDPVVSGQHQQDATGAWWQKIWTSGDIEFRGTRLYNGREDALTLITSNPPPAAIHRVLSIEDGKLVVRGRNAQTDALFETTPYWGVQMIVGDLPTDSGVALTGGGGERTAEYRLADQLTGLLAARSGHGCGAPISHYRDLSVTVGTDWLGAVSCSQPSTACAISTPYNPPDEVIHPCVAEMFGDFCGWRYILAITAYPGGIARYEDPLIYGSNDRTTWTALGKADRPLATQPTAGAYNSDPFLGHDPRTGELIVGYRTAVPSNPANPTDTNTTVTLQYRSTRDGYTWSEPRMMLQRKMSINALLAPSLLFEPETMLWHMWTINRPNMHHWTATSLAGPWTADAATVSISAFGQAHHAEVKWVHDKLVCILHDKDSANLYFGVFASGSWTSIAWSMVPLIQPQPRSMYKASFLPVLSRTASTLAFDLWWTGGSASPSESDEPLKVGGRALQYNRTNAAPVSLSISRRAGAALAEDDAPAMQHLVDQSGRVAGIVDLAGGMHLPGLGGVSVQDHIAWLRAKAARGASGTSAGGAVGEVAAPAVLRLTDAQNALFGIVDLVGGVHLPGLGGVSVQGHIDRLYRLRGTSSDGGQAVSTDNTVIDVVRDAGIDNGGLVNVSAAINALIQTVAASPTGPKTLFFPRGRYKLGNKLVPASGVNLIGAGDNQTVFAPAWRESAIEWSMADGQQEWLEGCTFANFAIDGADQIGRGGSNTGYSPLIKGMFFEGFRDCRFLHLRIEDTWATGLGIDFADGSLIDGVIVRRCGRGAAIGDPGASGIGIGTGWAQYEPLIVTNWISSENRNYGMFVERQTDEFSLYDARCTVVSNGIARGNNHAFGEAGCDGTIISGCQLTDSLSSNVILHKGTLSGGPHPGSRTILAHNTIARAGGAGIEYDATTSAGSRGYTSIGNRIEDNAAEGHLLKNHVNAARVVDDFAIRGDEIIGNGGSGIRVAQGYFTNLDILAPRLIRNTGAAIQIDGNITGGAIRDAIMRDLRGSTATQTASITGTGALTDIDIDGCSFVGPATAPINLTGTLTRVTTGRNTGM